MKSFASFFGKSKQNKLVQLAASAVAALALTGGINTANAETIKRETRNKKFIKGWKNYDCCI